MGPQHLVVLGAGIGGLTAALALARDGHDVTVLEQAPVLHAVGAGVTLAPNAMRVFGRLGLEAPLCAVGCEPLRQRVQHWRDGRVLVALERGDTMRKAYGAPYLYIHRADLHEILIEALRATGRAELRLGACGRDAVATPHGAVVILADGTEVRGDAVIAADGVKSAIRENFETVAPHFTGHIVWRAIVPVGNPLLEDLANAPGMHIGPGRMVVRYPVRSFSALNLVFFARREGWSEEGWAIPGTIAELRAVFGDWAPEVLELIAAIDETALNKWAVYARRPLPSYVHGGRIALLGDAAHAMTPFLGQGASSAAEDGMVLARCVAAADSIPEALARYDRARVARGTFLQEESNANADRMQGEETDLFGMAKLRNEETLGLFAYDAGTVEI